MTCSRILFLREVPSLPAERPVFVRVLAEVVRYDVSSSTIYVRDPTQRKRPAPSAQQPPLVRVDISEFRKEQITGFKNAAPFQCTPGEYLTILGDTYKIREKEKEAKEMGMEEGENENYSQVGIKARYVNCAAGTDIVVYAKAVEARRKYCQFLIENENEK